MAPSPAVAGEGRDGGIDTEAHSLRGDIDPIPPFPCFRGKESYAEGGLCGTTRDHKSNFRISAATKRVDLTPQDRAGIQPACAKFGIEQTAA